MVVLKALNHMPPAMEPLIQRTIFFAAGEKCGIGDEENTDDLFVGKRFFMDTLSLLKNSVASTR